VVKDPGGCHLLGSAHGVRVGGFSGQTRSLSLDLIERMRPRQTWDLLSVTWVPTMSPGDEPVRRCAVQAATISSRRRYAHPGPRTTNDRRSRQSWDL
jgi:hypothetical protein